jgi:hypothetical protein
VTWVILWKDISCVSVRFFEGQDLFACLRAHSNETIPRQRLTVNLFHHHNCLKKSITELLSPNSWFFTAVNLCLCKRCNFFFRCADKFDRRICVCNRHKVFVGMLTHVYRYFFCKNTLGSILLSPTEMKSKFVPVLI